MNKKIRNLSKNYVANQLGGYSFCFLKQKNQISNFRTNRFRMTILKQETYADIVRRFRAELKDE